MLPHVFLLYDLYGEVVTQIERSGMIEIVEAIKNQDDVPEALAYVALVRAHEALASECANLFKQHHISQPQYNALRILYWRGRPDGISVGEIRDRLVNRLPDVPRLIDRMEKAGLVERRTDPSDRRIVRVSLTEAGVKLLEELDEPLIALHKKQFAHLSPEVLQTFLRALQGLVAT